MMFHLVPKTFHSHQNINVDSQNMKSYYMNSIPLKSINLGHNFIDDVGLACFGNAFEYFEHLEELELNNNKISGYGISYLCAHLPVSITSLNLSYNHIGIIGASSLAYCFIPHSHEKTTLSSSSSSSSSSYNEYSSADTRNNDHRVSNLSRVGSRINSETGTTGTTNASNSVSQTGPPPNTPESQDRSNIRRPQLKVQTIEYNSNNNNELFYDNRIESLHWVSEHFETSYINLSLLSYHIECLVYAKIYDNDIENNNPSYSVRGTIKNKSKKTVSTSTSSSTSASTKIENNEYSLNNLSQLKNKLITLKNQFHSTSSSSSSSSNSTSLVALNRMRNRTMCDMTTYLPKLTKLNIRHTSLGGTGAWIFAHGLQAGGGRQLASLDISANHIGEVGKTAIGVAIIRAHPPYAVMSSIQNKKNERTRKEAMFQYPDLQNFCCDEIFSIGKDFVISNQNQNVKKKHKNDMFYHDVDDDENNVDDDDKKKEEELMNDIDMIESVSFDGMQPPLDDDNNSEHSENSEKGKEEEDDDRLNVLNLSDQNLVSADLVLIAGALFRHRTIHTLNLDGNYKIGHASPRHAHGPIPALVGASDLGGLCAADWKQKYLGTFSFGHFTPDKQALPTPTLYEIPLNMLTFYHKILSNLDISTQSFSRQNEDEMNNISSNEKTVQKNNHREEDEEINKHGNNNHDDDDDESDHGTTSSASSNVGSEVSMINVKEDVETTTTTTITTTIPPTSRNNTSQKLQSSQKKKNKVNVDDIFIDMKMPKELKYDGLSSLFASMEMGCASLKTISLNRVSFGNTQGTDLINLLRKKRGFKISWVGNESTLRSRVLASLQRNVARNDLLEVEIVPLNVVKLHLLGYSKTGKSTIRRSLDQTRMSTLFSNTGVDMKEDASGIQVSNITLPGGLGGYSPLYSVWDYSGQVSSRGLHSLNFLSSPNSVYAIVLSLSNPTLSLRRQLKYWLRLLISAIGLPKMISAPIVLIGTRGEQFGKLGDSILSSLLTIAKKEIITEDNLILNNDSTSSSSISANNILKNNNIKIFDQKEVPGWDNSNSAFFSLDVKSLDHRFNAFRSYLIEKHMEVVNECETNSSLGCLGFSLYQVMATRLKEWRVRGALFLRFDEFTYLCHSEISPSADESMIVSAARMLHHIGEILFIEQEYAYQEDKGEESGEGVEEEEEEEEDDIHLEKVATNNTSNANPNDTDHGDGDGDNGSGNVVYKMKRWVILNPNWLTFEVVGTILNLSSPKSQITNATAKNFFDKNLLAKLSSSSSRSSINTTKLHQSSKSSRMGVGGTGTTTTTRRKLSPRRNFGPLGNSPPRPTRSFPKSTSSASSSGSSEHSGVVYSPSSQSRTSVPIAFSPSTSSLHQQKQSSNSLLPSPLVSSTSQQVGKLTTTSTSSTTTSMMNTNYSYVNQIDSSPIISLRSQQDIMNRSQSAPSTPLNSLNKKEINSDSNSSNFIIHSNINSDDDDNNDKSTPLPLSGKRAILRQREASVDEDTDDSSTILASSSAYSSDGESSTDESAFSDGEDEQDAPWIALKTTKDLVSRAIYSRRLLRHILLPYVTASSSPILPPQTPSSSSSSYMNKKLGFNHQSNDSSSSSSSSSLFNSNNMTSRENALMSSPNQTIVSTLPSRTSLRAKSESAVPTMINHQKSQTQKNSNDNTDNKEKQEDEEDDEDERATVLGIEMLQQQEQQQNQQRSDLINIINETKKQQLKSLDYIKNDILFYNEILNENNSNNHSNNQSNLKPLFPRTFEEVIELLYDIGFLYEDFHNDAPPAISYSDNGFYNNNNNVNETNKLIFSPEKIRDKNKNKSKENKSTHPINNTTTTTSTLATTTTTTYMNHNNDLNFVKHKGPVFVIPSLLYHQNEKINLNNENIINSIDIVNDSDNDLNSSLRLSNNTDDDQDNEKGGEAEGGDINGCEEDEDLIDGVNELLEFIQRTEEEEQSYQVKLTTSTRFLLPGVFARLQVRLRSLLSSPLQLKPNVFIAHAPGYSKDCPPLIAVTFEVATSINGGLGSHNSSHENLTKNNQNNLKDDTKSSFYLNKNNDSSPLFKAMADIAQQWKKNNTDDQNQNQNHNQSHNNHKLQNKNMKTEQQMIQQHGQFVICLKGKIPIKTAYSIINKIKDLIESICYDYADLQLVCDMLDEKQFMSNHFSRQSSLSPSSSISSSSSTYTSPTLNPSHLNLNKTSETESSSRRLTIDTNFNLNQIPKLKNIELNLNNNDKKKERLGMLKSSSSSFNDKAKQATRQTRFIDDGCHRCIRKFRGKIKTNRLPYEILIENMADISFQEDKGRAKIISIHNPRIITHHLSDLQGKLLSNGLNGFFITAIYLKPWEHFIGSKTTSQPSSSRTTSSSSSSTSASFSASNQHINQRTSGRVISGDSSTLGSPVSSGVGIMGSPMSSEVDIGSPPSRFFLSRDSASSSSSSSANGSISEGTHVNSSFEDKWSENQDTSQKVDEQGGGGGGDETKKQQHQEKTVHDILSTIERDSNGFVTYLSVFKVLNSLGSKDYPIYISVASSSTITPSSSSSSSSQGTRSSNINKHLTVFDVYQTLICTNRASLPSKIAKAANSQSQPLETAIGNTFELSGAESIEGLKDKEESDFNSFTHVVENFLGNVSGNDHNGSGGGGFYNNDNDGNDARDQNNNHEKNELPRKAGHDSMEGGGWDGGDHVQWYISTVLISEHTPLLGKDMFIDYTNMAVCGCVQLSSNEAATLIRYANKSLEQQLLSSSSSSSHHPQRPSSPSSSQMRQSFFNEEQHYQSNRSINTSSNSSSNGWISPISSNKPKSSVLTYLHGFNTTPYFVCLNSSLYFRTLGQQLVIAVTWPSAPKPASGAGLVSLFISGSMDQPYAMAFNHMQASVKTFIGLPAFIKKSSMPIHQSTTSLGVSSLAAKGLNQSTPSFSSSSSIQQQQQQQHYMNSCNLYWKGHSMGSHLLLNIIEMVHWQKEPLSHLFTKVILDAPDVPNWAFREKVKLATNQNCRFLHLFNPRDQAVDVSRLRRESSDNCPGNSAIVSHRLVEAVDCHKAVSGSTLNHDYGRRDGFCIMDQGDFLSGLPPIERQLTHVPASTSNIEHWVLRSGR